MTDPAGKSFIPPPQHNLQQAVEEAVARLRGQAPDQLAWLGAIPAGPHWRVAVLGEPLLADLRDGTVRTFGGREVCPPWRILVLHYLAVRDRFEVCQPEVTFASLPDGRVYARVYEGRVIRRLCATVGRNASALRAAAAALSGEERPGPGGSLVFDLPIFPRLTFRLTWYPGDEELSPSAALLMPRNILSFLHVEDAVVLSECLVARMGGQGL